MPNLAKPYDIIKKLILTKAGSSYVLLVFVGVLLQILLAGCAGEPIEEQKKTASPELIPAIRYDPDQDVFIMTNTASREQDLRITSIIGVKKDKQREIVLIKADDLPDNGLVRRGESVEILIDDTKIQGLDALFVRFTDPSQQIHQSPSVELLRKPPPAVATEDNIELFYAFAANLKVRDSLRVIISKDIGGTFVLLDTILTKESATLSIKKEWVDRGYYLRGKTKNSAWSAAMSLRGLGP